MSPTRSHALLQRAIAEALNAWARGRGEVGPQWRFRITPEGEYTRPLVPDVAYLSYERSAPLTAADREIPTVAPEIVVEILSPGDQAVDVDAKRDDYISAGVTLVVVVDPAQRSVEAFEQGGSSVFVATWTSQSFPDLVIPLGQLFQQLDRPQS